MDLHEFYPRSLILEDPRLEGILEKCEKNAISCTDLALLSPDDLAQTTACDVDLAEEFMKRFLEDVDKEVRLIPVGDIEKVQRFTTGDAALDKLLNGGLMTKRITEIAGESATGKSNILTQLALSVQLPESRDGLGRDAIYISNENGFETRRMFDMLQGMAERYGLEPSDGVPSSDKIHCFTTRDQEEFEHVVRYQLSLIVERTNAGLIIIDSIASHYRMENDSSRLNNGGRSKGLAQLCRILRRLAEQYNLAVVCSNQVSERFIRELDPEDDSDQSQYFYHYENGIRLFSGWPQPSMVLKPRESKRRKIDSSGGFPSSSPRSVSSQSQYSVEHNSRSMANLEELALHDKPKVPFLGLQWAYFIDQRIVVKRYTLPDETRRTIEVVFSSDGAPGILEFKIIKNGVFMVVYE